MTGWWKAAYATERKYVQKKYARRNWYHGMKPATGGSKYREKMYLRPFAAAKRLAVARKARYNKRVTAHNKWVTQRMNNFYKKYKSRGRLHYGLVRRKYAKYKLAKR